MSRNPNRRMCTCGDDHRKLFAKRYIVNVDGCWVWQGNTDQNGYGRIKHKGHTWIIHRISYWAYKGDFPAELTIDHLCRNRTCINPDHLEPVTLTVNIFRSESLFAKNARRTHCKYGHPLEYMSGEDRRRCRTCTYARSALAKRKARAEARITKPEPLHGTRQRYKNVGCRCVRCKAANATYQRERLARVRQKETL